MRGLATRSVDALAWIGRCWIAPNALPSRLLRHTGGIALLFVDGLRQGWTGVGSRRYYWTRLVLPTMGSIAARTAPLVAVLSFLLSVLLVLVIHGVLSRYGQLDAIPGIVALSLTREIGHISAAMVVIVRVATSFTAVLGTMKIRRETLALDAMGIPPVAYLVTPRLIAVLVLLPCLTVVALLVGGAGGALMLAMLHDVPPSEFLELATGQVESLEILGSLAKAVVSAAVIGATACYHGLRADDSSISLGRHMMASVVACLIGVVIGDVLFAVAIRPAEA